MAKHSFKNPKFLRITLSSGQTLPFGWVKEYELKDDGLHYVLAQTSEKKLFPGIVGAEHFDTVTL